MSQSNDISIIKIPMLISAIFNAINAGILLVVGLMMLVVIVGCFILPFAIPLGVLCYFEFTTYSRLNSGERTPELRSRVQLIAIFEVAMIIFGNVPSMICGILTLTNMDKLDVIHEPLA